MQGQAAGALGSFGFAFRKTKSVSSLALSLYFKRLIQKLDAQSNLFSLDPQLDASRTSEDRHGSWLMRPSFYIHLSPHGMPHGTVSHSRLLCADRIFFYSSTVNALMQAGLLYVICI